MKKSALTGMLVLGLLFIVSPADAEAVRCSDQNSPSSCEGSCSPVKSDGRTYYCRWRSDTGTCQESGQVCSGNSPTDPTYPPSSVPTVNADYATCVGSRGTAPAGYWCAGCGGFCLSSSYTGGGCNNAQQAKCGQTATTGSLSCICNTKDTKGTATTADDTCTTWKASSGLSTDTTKCVNACPSGGTTCNFGSGAYLCAPTVNLTNTFCSANNGTAYTGSLSGCFCGTIQVDTATGHQTYTNQCGCSGTTTSSPPPPTTPPQNVPSNLSAVVNCPAGGGAPVATFNWSAVSGATSYYLRLDDTTSPWLSNCGVGTPAAGDTCSGNISSNTYSKTVVPGRTYLWWVSAFVGTTQYPATAQKTLVVPATCPTTTTPPPSTATCQSTSIFSPNWTAITPAQFSKLLPNSQVYFCVQGSTSNGKFTKGRFTINGKLYPETTLVRPGSSQFCSLYSVPASVYNFSVQGEVFHETLGWR